MKKILLLALLLSCGTLFAQRCRTAVSPAIYQQNFNQIAVLRGDGEKQVRAEQFVTANCVNSQQLKSIAQLFASDSVRLLVCKKAYPRVTDTANFFVVYDAFATFSYAIRMYDFVQHYRPAATQLSTSVITTTTVVTQPPSTPQGPVFPAVFYPDTARTTASKGCAGPVITDRALQTIADNVFRQPTEESKIVAIESAYTQNCMSMAQQMKLASLLQNDDNRMRVLKNGFARVYDQEHYSSATALFSVPAKKDEWNNYCAAYLTPPCVVSAQDFTTCMQQIRAKSMDSDQLEVVKLLTVDRCFSVEQLKAITEEFTFDDERMVVCKLCYAKCTDKQNYYQLVDKMTFSSNKDELRRFIGAGGK